MSSISSYRLLVAVTSLLYLADSVLYHVVPDDHLPANSTAYTLRHCISNSEKYFTSNVELHFLSGKHYLDKDLIVDNVINLSLFGDANNNVTIYCNTPKSVVFRNSKHVSFKYFNMKNCYHKNSALLLFNCSDFVIQSSAFECNYQQCGLVVIDAMGNSNISKIKSSQLSIIHNHTSSDVTTKISYYEQFGCCTNDTAIKIIIDKHSYKVAIYLFQIKITLGKPLSIKSSVYQGQNNIVIKEMKIIGYIISYYKMIDITMESFKEPKDRNTHGSKIQLLNCHFAKINSTGIIVYVKLNRSEILSIVYIFNCTFSGIQAQAILQTDFTDKFLISKNLLMIIRNTRFSAINRCIAVIQLQKTTLLLTGPVHFLHIVSDVIILQKDSLIQFKNSIYFYNNRMNYCLVVYDVLMENGAKLNIIANTFKVFFFTADNHGSSFHDISINCLIQYAEETYQLTRDEQFFHTKYKIIVKYNKGNLMFNRKFATSHCDWTAMAAFMYSDPHTVNQQVIQYVNNSFKIQLSNSKIICYCTADQLIDCSTDELRPAVFPGQTYRLSLTVSDKVSVETTVITSIDSRHNRACKSNRIANHIHLFQNNCTEIDYNIQYSKYAESCEIYLIITEQSSTKSGNVLQNIQSIEAYRIKLLPCPVGFEFNEVTQMCHCDPVLITVSSCNIDDQTVLRPADSWIKGNTNSYNIHDYLVSLQCPFDYCHPYSSHINPSNPDCQCQFNRTGLLCGRCREGFSAVFGTSQCKQCTNNYLFLLLPLTVAGIAVIMFLFMTNLTVANGNINGLIFYANIVSINGPVLFSSYTTTKYVSILISWLNLDLGIETCFYNGMDDYTKMWLQLIFPIYLIFLATLLIITSRYSTKIQRLTAHRALPVLATLFLLSYTKILRTVSSVLFSYSTITSLPNKTTTLVWSVDTEVKRFGLKFSLLFVVCFIIFLILLPFNIVLIFTRTLSRFKFINRFKPILDAYQGPYKDRFHYWTGVQLLLRAVFYGISALDRNVNLMIGIIILGAMESFYGKQFPFKSTFISYQEVFFLYNIQILFATSIVCTKSNSRTVNTLVGLALFQFTSLTFYRLVLHRKVKVTPVIMFPRKCLAKFFSFIKPVSSNFQLEVELRNPVPEIQHNYKEFQEPLIGYDQ